MNTRKFTAKSYTMQLEKLFQGIFVFIFAVSMMGVSPPAMAVAQEISTVAPIIGEGDSIEVAMSEDGSPTPFSLTLHATDGDAGDTLTWSVQTEPLHGAASAGGTGLSVVVNYVPDADYYGLDSFVVAVTDGTLTDSILVNVTIGARNDPPVAVDDEFFTTVDTPIHFVPADLIGNDLDVDGDPLSVATITNITNGSMSYWWFTPAAGFSGEASFDYEVSDGQVTDSGHVTIHVGDIDNTPPELTVTGATDGGAAMAGNLATGFILETENDPAVDHLIQFAAGTAADETLAAEHFGLYLTGSTVSAADLKAYYAVRGVPDPYLAYLNGAADGVNPFVYINGSTVKLVDGAKYFVQSADVDMTVPDDFPLGTYTVAGEIADEADNETTVTLILIVAGDREGPVLTVTGAMDGSAAMAGDLTTGFILETGNDPAVDHLIQFAAGTVADEILAADHFGLYLTGSTVSAADLKAYYATRGVPAPYLAYLNGAADGDNPFVYINGSTVKLVDGAKYFVQSTDVDMTVPDDFPLGTYTVAGEIADEVGNETTVTLILIVAGDREGPVLTVTGATDGGAAMAGDLATGFILETGNDPAVDHLIQFAAGTAADETLTADHFGLYLTGSTVSAADLKTYYEARGVPAPYLAYLNGAADGDNPFVYINGSTVKLVDGAKYFVQSADVDMTVPDDFPLGTYTVEGKIADLAGNETAVKLILIVSGDRVAPVLTVTGATDGGAAMAGDLATGFILETENDPAVDHLIQFAAGTVADETLAADHFGLYLTGSTVSAADLKAYYAARGVPAPYLAYLNGAADGVNPFVYINGSTIKLVDGAKYFVQSADVDMTVPDDFPLGTYTVEGKIADLTGNEMAVKLILIVTNPNDPPAFVETDPQAVTMSEDGDPTAFSLTLHVIDPDPDETLTWSILVPAGHGTATASGTGPSKVIGYIPTANYFGSDTFTVQVTDGVLTDSLVVNVTIASVNDIPVADAQSVIIHEGESIGIHLTGSDLEGDPLTFTVQTQPAHGTLSGVAPDLVYTPADNYTGADSFTFKVFDGTNDSLTATISILVKDPTPWMDEKLTTSKVTFNWKDTPGATKYRMELSTKADFSTVVFSVKTLESKYPYGTALKPSKTYYWRVKAKVGGFWENTWTTYKFYSMDPLTIPVLTSPVHRAIITDTHTPLLEWQKVDNAVSYRVVISNSSTFAVKLQKLTVDDPHYLAATLPNGKYYWRVRALDASGGKGPWSEIRNFKIVD